MARKGENIYKRSNGRWEGKYIKDRAEGKIQYGYVSGRSYEEVLMKKRKAMEACKVKSDIWMIQNCSFQFSVIAAEWLEAQEVLLKYSSISKYRNILNNYLIPEFGCKQVKEISREQVSAYVKGLLMSGGIHGEGLSPKYVTGILSVLKIVLDYASDHKKIQTADLKGIPIKFIKKPLRVLSVNEQHMLEKCLLDDIDMSGLGIMLCLYTGIRLGELCALKWQDISFTDQVLYIHSTMARIQMPGDADRKTKVVVTMPKSPCSVRYIPIPNEIFEMIRTRVSPDNTYFLTGDPKIFVEPRTMENRFKARIRASGIADANFHALRHTFATRCIELGFDARTLSEILGHASVKITMDRYVHPSLETKQKNMDKLSNIFSGK